MRARVFLNRYYEVWRPWACFRAVCKSQRFSSDLGGAVLVGNNLARLQPAHQRVHMSTAKYCRL